MEFKSIFLKNLNKRERKKKKEKCTCLLQEQKIFKLLCSYIELREFNRFFFLLHFKHKVISIFGQIVQSVLSRYCQHDYKNSLKKIEDDYRD